VPVLNVAVVLGTASVRGAEPAAPEYVLVEPVYESGFDEPLIEIEFTLSADDDARDVVTVRLMQRRGEITQSFLVPGDHPYVTEGFLLDRRGDGWTGRILLSHETRGGPARGMGTPRTSQLLDVELKRDEGGIGVTCKSGEADVPATARLVTWEEIGRQSDPLDASKSWPTWHGPDCNFAAEPCGHELVDDLRRARLEWKSQERFGSGKAQSPRYGVIPADGSRLPLLPSAGGASPVVAGGNVFVYYFLPSGEAVDEQLLAGRRERAGGGPLPPWEMELWRIAADDVIACTDGRTGQTLWRTRYPGAGANWHDSKAGPCNTTPCLHDGRLYVIGSTGRVYCLDAATGREVWQSSIGPRHFAIEEAKRAALEERAYGKLSFNRDFGGAPIVAGGALVMPDFTSHGACGLLALDAATGRRLWLIPGAAAEDATPLCYEHAGRQYVISGTAGVGADSPGKIVCVEPRTGEVRWTITEGIWRNQESLSIWGDYLIARAPADGQSPVPSKAEPAAMACFQISPDGYRHAWTLPVRLGWWKENPPSIVDGYLLARLIGPKLLCIEVATGRVVAEAENRLGESGATQTYAGGLLLVDRDGSHSATEIWAFRAGPRAGELEPLGEPWSPPHAHGTSYHPPCAHPSVDGRLLIRGGDGVYCYDLRKH
jgi:outer membrane protein assembly factor BamB